MNSNCFFSFALFLSVESPNYVDAQSNVTHFINDLLSLIDQNNKLFQYILDNGLVWEAFHVPFNSRNYNELGYVLLRKDSSLFSRNQEEFIKELIEYINIENQIKWDFGRYGKLTYDKVSRERKAIMKEIFVHYFRSQLRDQEMCNEDNQSGDTKCRLVGLIRSTEEQVLDCVYSPRCYSNMCLFYPFTTTKYGNHDFIVGGYDPGIYKEIKITNAQQFEKDSVISMILLDRNFQEILDW
ncbi:uncharacterized protein LOC126902427 isoform X2 [Daktulosphaira vitifoliae]|uniref:uncharacterized protein LOC126902427 isoform X2 n=1 Tax=Daktulosphaira vitifoliae TaxID=58002 RepID=UPI0021AAD211|nr:uncharacterized protein LOC126902427 isoform X2 [Daktulosphaira vitifoliae]